MPNPLTRNLGGLHSWQSQKSPYESPSILMANNTGINLISGDVVVVDPGTDRSVKLATAAGEASPLVVLADSFAGGNVRCYPLYGIARIICDGAAISPNDLIITSATARYGKALEAEDPDSILGVAVTSKGAAVVAEVAVLLLSVPSGGYGGGGGGGGVTQFRDLTDVDWASFDDDDFAVYDAVAGKIVGNAGGGGGGEANTGSNVGTAGIGIYDGKVGVDLQFRKLHSLSAAILITLDTPNQQVDFDLDEAGIDHNALLNYAANQHVVLPATIVEVLTDHDLAAHTALGLYSDPSEIAHNGLASLDGGAAGEYFHLTTAQHTELTAWMASAVLSASGSLDLGSGELDAEYLDVEAAAEASAAEVIAKFHVSDNAVGYLAIENNSATNNAYGPYIHGVATNYGSGLYIRAETQPDAGSNPVIGIQTRFNGEFVNVRPVLALLNYSMYIVFISAAGNVGLGTLVDPDTALHIRKMEPYITLQNYSAENTDYGREGRIIFKGAQSGGEITTLGVLEIAHDGAFDDERGVFSLKLNEGADGNAPHVAVTVLSDGSVGIGDTEPDELLAVGGHIHLDDDYKLLLGTGEDGEFFVSSDNLCIKNITANKDIIFNVNDGGVDTEVMRLLGSEARVGIGTASPTGLLHTVKIGGYNIINFDTYSATTLTDSEIAYRKSHRNTVGNTATIDGESLGAFGWWGNTGAAFQQGAFMQVLQEGAAGTYIPTKFRFRTSDGTAASVDRMVINKNGNVGIGTSTPATSAKLDISSTTGALLISRMTTVQKAALTAVDGMILYDSTLNKFQGYENGAWVSFI